MPVHTQRHGDRQSDRRRDKNRAEAGHHRLTAVRPVAIRRGSRRLIIPHIAGLRRVAARRAAAYAEPTQPAIAPAGRAALADRATVSQRGAGNPASAHVRK